MLLPLLDLDHAHAWVATGEALRAGGFLAGAVARVLGLEELAWTGLCRHNFERPLRGSGPEADRVDLLVRGNALPRERAHDALPPSAWEARLLEDSGDLTRARWLVLPIDGDLVLADRGDRSFEDDGLYIADSCSLLVRRCIPDERVARHLDLGSGAGAIAVRAARSAEQTVCIDINPRAGPAAQRSAALSGVDLAVHTGHVRDAEGTFDRVTFTCPLMVPWTYMVGVPIHTVTDEPGLLAETLALLPRLLAEGGLALIFCQSWADGRPLPVAIDRAFGDRPWRAAYWWYYEADSRNGRLRLGLLAIRADHGYGWLERRFDEPGPPGERWWPHLAPLLGEQGSALRSG